MIFIYNHAALGENGGGGVRQGMDCGDKTELTFIIHTELHLKKKLVA
jgi:hypothetical protein